MNLLNEIYGRKSGRDLPLLDASVLVPGPIRVEPTSRLSLEWLAEQTLWPVKRLQEIVSTIQTVSPQIVLAGPPGTSKTWIAQLIARYLTEDNPTRYPRRSLRRLALGVDLARASLKRTGQLVRRAATGSTREPSSIESALRGSAASARPPSLQMGAYDRHHHHRVPQ